jgi:hypothetical protein
MSTPKTNFIPDPGIKAKEMAIFKRYSCVAFYTTTIQHWGMPRAGVVK